MTTTVKDGTRAESKGTFIHCGWECKLVQLLWEAAWRFLNKNKNRAII